VLSALPHGDKRAGRGFASSLFSWLCYLDPWKTCWNASTANLITRRLWWSKDPEHCGVIDLLRRSVPICKLRDAKAEYERGNEVHDYDSDGMQAIVIATV